MIDTFDNELSFKDRQHIYRYVINSTYKLVGWSDSDDLDIVKHDIHSKWSLDDLRRSRLYPVVVNLFKKSKKFKGDLTFQQCVVNLVKHGDYYYPHTHGKDIYGALYYVNLDWKSHYGGETIFYDDQVKDIIYTTPYVPGRLILFDGAIPHTIRPQSSKGPNYRFTITIFFKKGGGGQ